jgi:hypothetical protein
VRLLGAEPSVAGVVERAGLAGWVTAERAVPRAEVGAALRRAHACLHLAPPGALGGDPVPGKLFDAVGAGRPLVSLTPEGAVARLVRRLELGVALDPSQPERVIEALEPLRRAALRGEAIAGPPAHARAALDSSRTIPRLVAALAEAARGRTPHRDMPWTSPSPS